MTQQEMQEEILRCQESPYYFATKYIKVKNHKGEMVNFTTPLSEEKFNEMFKELQNERNISNRTR
jgi:hypothetical protein